MSSVNGSIAILDQVLFIIKIPDYYWSQIIFLDVNALFPKMLMLHAFYSTQNSNTAITNNEVWIIFFRCLYAKYNKQLLDEVERDIMNYQSRGLCYLPKPKAEADNTDTRV